MVVFQISAGAYPCLQHGPAHIPNEYRPPFSVDHLPGEVEQVVKQRGSTVSPEIRPVLFVELVRVFYRVTSDGHGAPRSLSIQPFCRKAASSSSRVTQRSSAIFLPSTSTEGNFRPKSLLTTAVSVFLIISTSNVYCFLSSATTEPIFCHVLPGG